MKSEYTIKNERLLCARSKGYGINLECQFLAEGSLPYDVYERLLWRKHTQASEWFARLRALVGVFMLDTAKDQRHDPSLLEESEDGKLIHHLT